jgi:hypothetical protein
MMIPNVHIEPATDVLFARNHLEIVRIWKKYGQYCAIHFEKTKTETEKLLSESMTIELIFPID